MKRWTISALLTVATAVACAPRAAPPPTAGGPPPDDGARPQYDREGRRLTFAAGPPGRRRIQVLDLAGGATTAFGDDGSDAVDPTFTPDGRIVFASNRDGDYDLFLLDLGTGATERLTDLEGDELEPTVASIPFGFYAVHEGVCGGEPDGVLLDAYQKVLFVRRTANTSEIWFSSIRPTTMPKVASHREPPPPSAHGSHQGRVSPPGRACAEPAFAPDGLSVVWVCDGRVEDAPARYPQTFAAALATIRTEPPEACRGSSADMTRCLPALEREYAKYPGRPVSRAEAGISRPSVSANQTLLVADADGRPLQAPRFVEDPAWSPLGLDAPRAAGIVWSPTGREVAFTGVAGVGRAPTRHYLQTVHNLHRFPELFGAQESPLLEQNRFVVRPAAHKEFYVRHEELRYASRPQFITVDVALQAFRDEYLRLLEGGEREAAAAARQLTRGLFQRYAARLGAGGGSRTDRYYAVLFATAWAPLEAAATMERLNTDELVESAMAALGGEGEARAPDDRVERLRRPVAARLPEELPRVVAGLPASIRSEVKAHLDRMLLHEGLVDLNVPGRAEPVKIDFSQFAVRGAYAENDLAGYFLAMGWLGSIPLPMDPSLRDLVATLRTLSIEPDPPTQPWEDEAPPRAATGLELWRRADAVVGSFMGRPVDATLDQLAQELDRMPGFDARELERRLLARRGEVPIRDADNRDRALFVTVFPRRLGLDVTFFRALTHPAVPGRGMPSALDVFAALGDARAREHAVAAAGASHRRYQAALDALAEKTRAGGSLAGYASTDLYHGWLALLVAVATPPALPDGERLAFAKSLAWRDRQLYSALAGYTQLKHSAVLYAMQDMGVECDGDTSYLVAVEEPILPAVRGFVEPNVPLYEGLAALAREAYRRLFGDPEGPTADRWADETVPRLNAMNFARELAEIARAEVAGRPLTDEQARFVELVGGRLEALTLGMGRSEYAFSTGGAGREERGVALVTDIHSNTDRQQALELGIGRIFDLWVVVPGEVGETLTQGGVLSFYEFTAPMSERLTDAAWGERVASGTLPPRPPWTRSFIEER